MKESAKLLEEHLDHTSNQVGLPDRFHSTEGLKSLCPRIFGLKGREPIP